MVGVPSKQRPNRSTWLRSPTRLLMVAALFGAVVGAPAGPAAADAAAELGRADRPWMNPALSADRRADLVVARMTLAEKVMLVTGVAPCVRGADGFVRGVPRLGIPELTLIGGGMGVTNVCQRPVHGKATELPAPIAMAASWDPQLAYEDGALIGTETRNLGFNVSIGGNINLVRDPRGGRTWESAGEDPYLAGVMVGAQLRGTQDQHIPATIKHFALNNAETHRLTQSSNVDERTMRELYLRGFEIAIERSDVAAVMCAYNKVNGVPACQNRYLLTEVLKQDWGFKGWVMTDWWACAPPAVRDPRDFCSTEKAAHAGLDQVQPNASYYGPSLYPAVLGGEVSRARLNDMVHRIVRSLFATGLIDDPPTPRPVNVVAGANLARRIAEQSSVLLKNEADVLPLDRKRISTIAVIGGPADDAPARAEGSSGTVDPIAPDTPLQGIRDAAPDARVRYADGSDTAAAAALAGRSDVAIVYARDTEAEGKDRTSLALDGNADRLIAAVAAANPRTVVVLMTGSAVTMPWLDAVPAVLEAWYPGQRGGHAIARLLFGEVSPSGRLPITFPARASDLPTAGSPEQWPGDADDIEYREGLLIGYRWYDEKGIEPLFPFGHGLTYGAEFGYDRLRVDRSGGAGAGVTVRFRVTNTGTRRAAAVPQVYLHLPDPSPTVTQPPKVLRGFDKITLAPGSAEVVTVELGARDFSYWDVKHDRWTISPGCYGVLVGASSRDIRLREGIPIGAGDGPAIRPSSASGRADGRRIARECTIRTIGQHNPRP